MAIVEACMDDLESRDKLSALPILLRSRRAYLGVSAAGLLSD